MTFQPPVRRDDNWIRTFTGRRFWPLNPSEDDLHILDIASGLSTRVRFTGQTHRPYTVAQHSVLCYRTLKAVGAEQWQLRRALLHDASEAYLPDVAAPVKRDLPYWSDIEFAVMRCIASKYDFPWSRCSEDRLLKYIDIYLLKTEAELNCTSTAQNPLEYQIHQKYIDEFGVLPNVCDGSVWSYEASFCSFVSAAVQLGLN